MCKAYSSHLLWYSAVRMNPPPYRLTIPLLVIAASLFVYFVIDALEISRGTVIVTGPVYPLHASIYAAIVAIAVLVVSILLRLKWERTLH